MVAIVIFGASGDISHKKVIPGLYEWYKENNKAISTIIGFGRTKLTTNEFIKTIDTNYQDADFMELLNYQIGGYNQKQAFNELKDTILESGANDIIFYFGIPSYISPIAIHEITQLSIYQSSNYNCRFIVEKPIGTDLNSCNKILDEIYQYITEDQLYILDHYLGKSSIRDIINLNTNDYKTNNIDIQSLSIILNEEDDVNHRLEYFNNVGIFKDMIQSHGMVILYYLKPDLFTSQNINGIKINNIIKAQYNSYKGGQDTDTYIKVDCLIGGINIILEAGKGLYQNSKNIVINGNNMPINTIYSEYKTLFQDALNNNKSKYLSREKLISFWLLSEKIWQEIAKESMQYYTIGNKNILNNQQSNLII